MRVSQQRFRASNSAAQREGSSKPLRLKQAWISQARRFGLHCGGGGGGGGGRGEVAEEVEVSSAADHGDGGGRGEELSPSEPASFLF